MSFVPGPWRRVWSHTSDGERTEEAGRIVSERFGTICHMVMADDVDDNARLIAASPDLLALAKRIVGAAISAPEDRETKLQEVAELARSVISRATERKA